MKHIWKQLSCLALSAVLMLSLLPAAAAADGEDVLLTLGHASASAPVSIGSGQRDVTLYVPASYTPTTLDLFQGLDISYDTGKYQNVVAAPAGKATVGGAAVTLTVSYTLIGGDGAVCSTVYLVSVKKADPIPAVFTGAIDRSSLFPASLSFSASDFTQKYTPNDSGAMTHISISGSNLIVGTLLYNGSAYSFGQPVALADIPKLTFSASAAGSVTYSVSSYAANDTAHPIGSVLLTIQVQAVSVPTVSANPIAKSTAAGSSVNFSFSDFVSSFDLQGGTMSYIEIDPDLTTCGFWYAEGTSFTEPKQLTSATIGTLKFSGAAPGTATFRWRVSNQAGYSDYGSGTVTVTAPALVLSSYAGPMIVKGNSRTFSASSLLYSPSTYTIKLVKIVSIPNSSDATLSLSTALAADATAGYPAIAAGKALTAGAVIPYSYLSSLVLTTKSSAKNTNVSFTWAATAQDTITAGTVWSNTASYTVPFATGGTVYYSTDVNSPVTLAASDFVSAFSSASGMTLSYVTFTMPQAAAGKLYVNYVSPSNTGAAASSSAKYYPSTTPNLSSLTFVPASNYTGTITVSYKAYATDSIYCEGTMNITVSNSAGGTVTYAGDRAAPISLDANDFKAAFKNATGQTLAYVTFSLPAATYGKLYYRYTSDYDYESVVSSSTKYYVGDAPYLSYVSFVPVEDYIGEVIIPYYGYSTSGNSYLGKLKLTLADSAGGIVLYSANKNTPVRLEAADFAAAFINATGSALYSVKFTSSVTSGKLYVNYDASVSNNKAAGSGTAYYLTATPSVSTLTFVPNTDYTGTVTIPYTGTTAAGVSYAGKCKIAFTDGVGGTVSYTTDADTPVDLRASDFYNAFFSYTGEPLSYVTFTLPSPSYGRLYYNYSGYSSSGSPVTAGTRYYPVNDPCLSDITFAPNSSYTGPVVIAYTGYTPTGASYSGRLKISVDGGELNTVYLSTLKGAAVSLSSSSFASAFSQSTGKSLSYVKFTLPSSLYGTLYLNYSSSGTSGSSASSSAKYYLYSSPSLASLSFVPAENYFGTVSILYRGYTADGDGYSGTLEITVADNSAGTVTCSMLKNKTLTLDADAFNDAFRNRTGSSLYSVKFSSPSAAKGKLYYNYSASGSYGSAVSDSSRYYRNSSPGISDITFVPAGNYTGIVSIDYSAYDSSGNVYDGLLIITVSNAGQYFSDVHSGYSWAEDAVNYLYLAEVVTGTPDGLYHPGNSISRGDFILMLYRAFSMDASGVSNFSDVPAGSYYYSAISAARALGIAQGGSGNQFSPNSALTREDAAALLLRTLNAMGKSLETGSASDLYPYSDRVQISSYARDAVAALVHAGIMEGAGSRLSPKASLSRAEMALILYRVLTR